MKVLKTFTIVLLQILIISSLLFAKGDKRTGDKILKSTTIDNTTYIDANNILMFVTNHGNFGRDLAGIFGYDYGTFFPYTGTDNIIGGVSTSSPLYAAGLWIGGKVNGEVRVATSEYGSEFVPGPMLNGTFQTDQSDFKVYKLYYDSLVQNPNEDFLNWPTDQGAPGSFNAMLTESGDQMLWTVFNDADPAKHNIFSSNPLGIEVQLTAWSYGTSSSAYNSSTMLMYKLYNKGANTIDSCYFSLWADPDLGGWDDDLGGCDTLSNAIFCYNANNADDIYIPRPPAIGFKLLYGPIVEAPGEQAFFDMKFIDDYRNLPMSSATSFKHGTDADNKEEVFSYMKGLDAKNNIPYQYAGRNLSYLYSGNPITGTGDLDPIATDKRIFMSAGPFTFTPGDSQCVLIKMAVGQGMDRLSSITTLKQILNFPFNVPTDAPDASNNILPENFTLSQNYPNPFNPATTIKYTLPTKSKVTIEIFNVLGQRVKTLFDQEQEAGNHQIIWNGTNQNGEQVSTGMYMYKLTAGDFESTKKMLLLK